MGKNRYSRRSFLSGLGVAAVGIGLSNKLAFGAEEPKLNFYNWDTYIGENTLPDFRKKTGISVTMDLFADNDELFSKFRAGNPGYDVIVPSNDFVERMIAADILQKLDHSKIPNFNNIEKEFQDKDFDPQRKYSLPYMWGTMGVGYRKSKMKEGIPNSWKYLFESSLYSGKIALLGEARTILGITLKYLGYSLNTTNVKEIAEAEALLIKQKPHIKTFADDNGQDLLLSGECDIVMEWNGDILQVIEEDDDLAYIVPQEGSIVWEDTLVIPKGAPHPDNAHKFINFILDGKVGAEIANFIQYATPNRAAKQYLPKEYLNNPAIFPSQEALARLESTLYLGEKAVRLYDEAWTRIQAA